MKFILGKKIEMTQLFKDDGNVVPVTAVLATPNIVAQVKNSEKDGYNAIQVGFDNVKKVNKPLAGHLKGSNPVRYIREFKISTEENKDLKQGDKITVRVFAVGDKVKVTGTSKGKGFQGVVKRHGFHGAPATHGHKDQERMPGSIGATDAARVFKGKRMPGQMGNSRVTVSGLEIVDVDYENNILYVKGAVPGARNTLLLISGPGEMDLTVETKVPEADKEVQPENKVEEKSEEQVEEKKSDEAETSPKEEKSASPDSDKEDSKKEVVVDQPQEEKKEESKK